MPVCGFMHTKRQPTLPDGLPVVTIYFAPGFLYTAMVQRITSGHIPADAYSALRLADIIA